MIFVSRFTMYMTLVKLQLISGHIHKQLWI